MEGGRAERKGGREGDWHYLEVFVGEVFLCDGVGYAGSDVASVNEAAIHLGTEGEEGGWESKKEEG